MKRFKHLLKKEYLTSQYIKYGEILLEKTVLYLNKFVRQLILLKGLNPDRTKHDIFLEDLRKALGENYKTGDSDKIKKVLKFPIETRYRKNNLCATTVLDNEDNSTNEEIQEKLIKIADALKEDNTKETDLINFKDIYLEKYFRSEITIFR